MKYKDYIIYICLIILLMDIIIFLYRGYVEYIKLYIFKMFYMFLNKEIFKYFGFIFNRKYKYV